MWATSVIFKKLPKVNNRPLGENSPNLVTLLQRPILNFAPRGEVVPQGLTCPLGVKLGIPWG
jgi:hypothetical protein